MLTLLTSIHLSLFVYYTIITFTIYLSLPIMVGYRSNALTPPYNCTTFSIKVYSVVNVQFVISLSHHLSFSYYDPNSTHNDSIEVY